MKKLNAIPIFLLLNFFSGFTARLIFITAAIYRIEEVGLDPLQLVLVGTTLEVTAFIFEIPTGTIADLYSRRLSIIIGVFIMGFGFMIEGFAPLFSLVLISQVVWGLGWTFISGARSAWITDEIGVDNVPPVFLQGRQVYMLGNLLAIPTSIWLANLSLAYPYLAGGVLRILFGFFLVAFMPETNFKRSSQDERQTWASMIHTAKKGFRHVRGSALLLIYVFIGLFVGLYSEGWDRLGNAHLLENFTFPPMGNLGLGAIEWFGIYGAVILIAGIIVAEVVKKRMENTTSLSLTRVLQVLYGVMIVSMVGFALVGNFWVAIALKLVFDTMRFITFPLTEAWLNRQIPSEIRATVLSMTSQIDALGQAAGGPIIGVIGKLRSISTAILVASGILTPTVPLYGLAIRQGKNDQGKESVEESE